MVWPVWREPHKDNAYWTLPVPDDYKKKAHIRSELEEIGYKTKRNLSRAGLIELLQHHGLGHVCYDQCTDNDLRTFPIDRGLVSKNSKATSPHLVGLLLKADKSPSFHGFCDLPLELRVRV